MLRSGLDVLLSTERQSIQGKRIGLLTHAAAIDQTWRSSIEAVASIDGVRLVRVFGPEHGLHGQAQDLIGVRDDEAPGLEKQIHAGIVSLYGKTVESLKPTPEQLDGLDCLIVDLQDIGSRFYTFQATMKYCLEVALPMGLSVIVLDRPNPIGGLRRSANPCGRSQKIFSGESFACASVGNAKPRS